ncbi:hypothetical protein JIX58_06540 [Brevundimonas diminuta]|nr:hypothetical protein [Brevundimonas diminuta]
MDSHRILSALGFLNSVLQYGGARKRRRKWEMVWGLTRHRIEADSLVEQDHLFENAGQFDLFRMR